jgi:hypothetical protein
MLAAIVRITGALRADNNTVAFIKLSFRNHFIGNLQPILVLDFKGGHRCPQSLETTRRGIGFISFRAARRTDLRSV